MAEQQGASSMNFSMKATVYGIKMKFPSVQNISCHQLEQWKKEKNLICLVKGFSFNIIVHHNVVSRIHVLLRSTE